MSTDQGVGGRLYAFFQARPGEVITTDEALRAVGLRQGQRREYDRGCKALSRLAESGKLERLSKGAYRLLGSLTPKELRERLARQPALFHGVELRADVGGASAFSSKEEASAFFMARGGLLAAANPREGREAGNKLTWRVPLGDSRAIIVCAHAHGLDAQFATTDAPLDPSALACFVAFLQQLTGIEPESWVMQNSGIHKDLVDVQLSGISEFKVTLRSFTEMVLRAYNHGSQGFRLEFHTPLRLPLPAVLAFLDTGAFAQESRLARIEDAEVELAASLQTTRRLVDELLETLSSRERRATRRHLKRLR